MWHWDLPDTTDELPEETLTLSILMSRTIEY